VLFLSRLHYFPGSLDLSVLSFINSKRLFFTVPELKMETDKSPVDINKNPLKKEWVKIALLWFFVKFVTKRFFFCYLCLVHIVTSWINNLGLMYIELVKCYLSIFEYFCMAQFRNIGRASFYYLKQTLNSFVQSLICFPAIYYIFLLRNSTENTVIDIFGDGFLPAIIVRFFYI